jgi:hypothetical protein
MKRNGFGKKHFSNRSYNTQTSQQNSSSQQQPIRLEFDPNTKKNNFPEFRDRMRSYLVMEFGKFAYFIDNDQYSKYKIDMQPPKVNQPHETAMYHAYLNKKIDFDSEYEQVKPKIFRTLYDNLSENARFKIKQHKDWNNLNPEFDSDRQSKPLNLWLLIKECFLIGNEQERDEVWFKMRQDFDQIRQGATENIIRYKERFDKSLKRLNDLSPDRPKVRSHSSSASTISGINDQTLEDHSSTISSSSSSSSSSSYRGDSFWLTLVKK